MQKKLISFCVLSVAVVLTQAHVSAEVKTFPEAVKIMESIALQKNGIDAQGGIQKNTMDKIKEVLLFVEGEVSASACRAQQAEPTEPSQGRWEQQIQCERRCVQVGRRRWEWRMVRTCRWVFVQTATPPPRACKAQPNSLWETTNKLLEKSVRDQVLAGQDGRRGSHYALQVLAVVLAADTVSSPGRVAGIK